MVSWAEFWKMNTLSTAETPLSGWKQDKLEASFPFPRGLIKPIPRVTERWLMASDTASQLKTLPLTFSMNSVETMLYDLVST